MPFHGHHNHFESGYLPLRPNVLYKHSSLEVASASVGDLLQYLTEKYTQLQGRMPVVKLGTTWHNLA